MIIRNAAVYRPDHQFHLCDLAIRNERLCEDTLPQPGEEILDVEGLMALPGLVDLHFHGAMGHDFCEGTETAIQALADFEASRGVLAICPATMTYEEETLRRVMRAAAAHGGGSGSDLVGINLEGPFISPDKVGAQNPRYLHPPDTELFFRLQKEAGGRIKLVDIAPEEPGALRFIEEVSPSVRVSLAHTCADYDTAKEAFQRGASHVTHLYNAMPGIGHRQPGPILAALEEHAEVELIADGVHIHPAVVRFTFRLFGDDRVILISDSMMACGLPDGEYTLGGQPVSVNGSRCTLRESPGTIAGSAACLYDCMRTAVMNMGIPLESAVRAATENPAKSIGIGQDYGSLCAGHFGNVILADRDLRIVHIIKKGAMLS